MVSRTTFNLPAETRRRIEELQAGARGVVTMRDVLDDAIMLLHTAIHGDALKYGMVEMVAKFRYGKENENV